MRSPRPRQTRFRRGITLVEMLIAIFILGIGIISIAALFPAGIAQQRLAVDDAMGPVVANNAYALIRSRVKPSDFGTVEEFNVPYQTVPGDWTWLRPAVVYADDPNTTYPDGSPMDDTGFYDIFSWNAATGNVKSASEYASGIGGGSGFPQLFGVPYHTDTYGLTPPKVLITQGERYYPQQSQQYGTTGLTRPQYVWDCMFRRFEGRIQVAIFVFRVTLEGGDLPLYIVPQNPSNNLIPPLPISLNLMPGGWDADVAVIPGTAPGDAFDPDNNAQSWQAPGQWLLDQNGNVHRVLSGRRTDQDGPVELVRAPAALPTLPIYIATDSNTDVVQNIWYIPKTLDVGGTRLLLSPIYVTVKDL